MFSIITTTVQSEESFTLQDISYVNAKFQNSDNPILDVNVRVWDKAKLKLSISPLDINQIGFEYDGLHMDVKDFKEYVFGLKTDYGRFQVNYLRNKKLIGLNYSVRFTM